MNRKFLCVLLLFVFLGLKGNTQELLTPKGAIETALKNNFNIILARNSSAIDSLNVSPGFAGMLPQLNLVVENNNGIRNLTQTRSDGVVNSLSNARNNSFNYGVILDWTIFDGFQMFARYKQLEEIQKLGKAELQQAIFNNISNVLLTYYDIVNKQQQLKVLDSTMVISQQRLDLSHNRYTIGKASKLEELNARVDLNTDQAQLLLQSKELKNSKVALNELLALDAATDFRVINEIPVDQDLFLPDLESNLLVNNPELLVQVVNKQIAELELKRVKSGRYPIIAATTGYNFNTSENSLGFTTNSSSNGFSYGFRVSMNIFDGWNQNRSEKIAKMDVTNNEIMVDQKRNSLMAELTREYENYQTNLNLVELERKNELIAKDNLEITLEKYRIGSISTIEFRTAQLNYFNAQWRYSNALFQAKLSEISLKALSGNLPL